jgi:hypothetical protein
MIHWSRTPGAPKDQGYPKKIHDFSQRNLPVNEEKSERHGANVPMRGASIVRAMMLLTT